MWVSVAGFTPEEFGVLAETAVEARASAIELNFGCPNIWHEGSQKPLFSYRPDEIASAMDHVRRRVGRSVPVGAKLSPIPDLSLMSNIDDALRALLGKSFRPGHQRRRFSSGCPQTAARGRNPGPPTERRWGRRRRCPDPRTPRAKADGGGRKRPPPSLPKVRARMTLMLRAVLKSGGMTGGAMMSVSLMSSI